MINNNSDTQLPHEYIPYIREIHEQYLCRRFHYHPFCEFSSRLPVIYITLPSRCLCIYRVARQFILYLEDVSALRVFSGSQVTRCLLETINAKKDGSAFDGFQNRKCSVDIDMHGMLGDNVSQVFIWHTGCALAHILFNLMVTGSWWAVYWFVL